jgi:pSer/pThr/pTyr-binding forkhead associated (FHA) protein
MKAWLQNVGTATPSVLLCLEEFPFIIGRRRDCQGCLPYAFISRHHCQFWEENGQILVKDLESYNGTYVNGNPALTPLAIVDGDEVTLGPISFVVLMPKADAETGISLHTKPEISHSDAPEPSHKGGS